MSGAAASAGRLAKPQLRGHLNEQIKWALVKSGLLAFGTALGWKYGVAEPRKRRYAEFYRTYDADADSDRLEKLGMFRGFVDLDEDNEVW